MLGRIKALLTRGSREQNTHDIPPSEASVRRWTDEELDVRRQALENLPLYAWTATEHYAALEYIVQRYYPRSEPLLRSNWDAAMERMRCQVDANLQAAAGGTLPPSDFEEINQRYQEFREQLHRSYAMPLADFQRIVMPGLQRYPFAEGLALDAVDTERLWNASASVLADGPPAARYARSDARDQLLGRVGPTLIDAAVALRSTYETLRRARNAGCTEVVLIAPLRCGCVHDLLDGRTAMVADLLRALEVGAPQIPPPRTPCTVSEAPDLCRVSIMPIEPRVSRPGDEADFADWLDANLSTPRSSLDADWEAKLEERVAQRLASPG